MGKATKRKRLEESIVKGEPVKLIQKLEFRFTEAETREALKEKSEQFKLKESTGGGKRKLMVTVEGIHTGMTKNLTFYGGETLESSVPTWTTPHAKPILTNHNEYSEPLGRIRNAEYVESIIVPGKYTTRMQLEISNQEAIDKILDGRFLTLSVGGSANKVTCSTCGKNIVAEGFCGHYRGRKYEGKTEATHWMIGEYTGDEISFVNMPADVFAQVIAMELVTGDEGGKDDVGKPKKKGENAKNKKPENQTEETELDLIGNLTESEDDDDQEDDIDDGLDESTDNEDDDQDDNDDGDEGESGDQSESTDNEDGDEGEDDDDEEETLEEKVARLEGVIAEKDQEIETLTTRAEEADASVISTKAELDEANEKLATTETELSEAKDNLQSAEEERDTFQKQNLKLAHFSKKLMAERVVDLRIMQQKDSVEDRDSLVVEWSKSAPKVLESAIQDLQKSGQRFIARVTSPGLVTNESEEELEDDADEFTESFDKNKKPKKPITMADLEEAAVRSMSNQWA